MKIPFVKMHGAFNDFVLVDEWEENVVAQDKKPGFVVKACDRRAGIGSDGVIFAKRSDISDAKFVFYNPDGTIAEMCGNGIRCFAKYLYDTGYINKTEITVETLAGRKNLSLTLYNDKVEQVRVDMGAPRLLRQEIGMSGNQKDTFINQDLEVDGRHYNATAVSMGNPHAVLFVDDVEKVNVLDLGGKIRNMKGLFPKGVNVHFVSNDGKNRFKIRSFERGVESETFACGTGVCASAAAIVVNKIAEPSKVFKFMTRGGELNVELIMDGARIADINLIGPAVESFRGVIEYEPSEKFQKAAYNFIGDALNNR